MRWLRAEAFLWFFRQSTSVDYSTVKRESFMLAKNKSGWSLLKYLDITEDDICKYKNVTGSYVVLIVGDKVVVGFNNWRDQWELPSGGIEEGETARQAAIRELYEETHQVIDQLDFKGLIKVIDPKGCTKYQAVFAGCKKELNPFIHEENDEMEKICLWDMKESIGYVDECDKKIVEIVYRSFNPTKFK